MRKLLLGVAFTTACVWMAGAGEAEVRTLARSLAERPLISFAAISGRPTAADMERSFDACLKAGIDQFMLYPRSGLEYEYMGEDWLTFVGETLALAEKKGMRIWLYDEFNWPSGSCMNRVPEGNPDWAYTDREVGRRPDGSFEWSFYRLPDWAANNFDAGAAERFRELTHYVYEKRFRRYFGKVIVGIFTDEPSTSCDHYAARHRAAEGRIRYRWYRGLDDEYRLATGGRCLERDVEAALVDPVGAGKVWETYTELIGKRFRKTHFDATRAWCDRMGILFTGHLDSESNYADWSPRENGLPLHVLKGLSLPGMDEICTRIGRTREWLTFQVVQHAALRNGNGGMAELFALGPSDMTWAAQRAMLWQLAAHGVDHYLVSMNHLNARGWIDPTKDWAMFASPTQPWFGRYAEMSKEAARAAAWARKPMRIDVAFRYPQRRLGRYARLKDGVKTAPRLVEFVRDLVWNQVGLDAIEEDELCDKPIVFAWDDQGRLVDERTGTIFKTHTEALDYVRSKLPGASWVEDSSGVRPGGILLREYADGAALAVNLTDKAVRGLALVRRDGSRLSFDLEPWGVFTTEDVPLPSRRRLAEIDGKWTLSFDRPFVHRIRFDTNGVASVTLAAPLAGARFLVRDYPEKNVKVFCDGKPIRAVAPCTHLVYAYDELYRETAPLDLEVGTHEFRLEGLKDDRFYLPVLFLTEVQPRTPVNAELGSLPAPFVGEATYRISLKVPVKAVALELDTGDAVAEVTLGGRSLGLRGWGPFAWEIPADLRGKDAELSVTVVTSVRPLFGPEKVPGTWPVRARFPFQTRTGLNAAWFLTAANSLPTLNEVRATGER